MRTRDENVNAATIRAAREKLGMNRTQFAEKLGRTYDTVVSWEHGRRVPCGSMILSIARLAEMPVEDFFRFPGQAP